MSRRSVVRVAALSLMILVGLLGRQLLSGNLLVPTDLSIDAVPSAVRDHMFGGHSSSDITITISRPRVHRVEQIDGKLLVAATYTQTFSSSNAGRSSVQSMWAVALYEDSEGTEPRQVVHVSGVLDGTRRPAEFMAGSGSIVEGHCTAAGIAYDKRIVNITGLIAGDTVTAQPVNGFWFMQHEGGTGWLEFRAVDRVGSVISTLRP